MGRVAGAGKQVLIPICWFFIKVCVNSVSSDFTGSIQEGNALLYLTVTVITGLGLSVAECKFNCRVNFVNFTGEFMEQFVGSPPHHEDVKIYLRIDP